MRKLASKIPESWENITKILTRSELLETRKKEALPDPSFDLDGDGIVSGKDLCIAKQFDLDRDGKLSPIEKRKALEALSRGFDEKFMWGCESSGVNRSFRIVQKRGNVILNEEFNEIKGSYPEYPAKKNAKLRSKTELEEYRKKEIKDQEKYFEGKISRPYRLEIPISANKAKLTPTDGYSPNPRFKTKNELKEGKRKELVIIMQLDELNNSCNFNYKTQLDRLMQREKKIYSTTGTEATSLAEKLKIIDVSHFSKTFASRPLGIHGRELPKFSENLQEFLNERNLNIKLETVNEEVVNKERSGSISNTVRKDRENLVKKPTEIEIMDHRAIKEFCRNSRWSNDHYKFTQRSVFETPKKIKSRTPDMGFHSKALKPQKFLITHRMMNKGSFSPLKNRVISKGFYS